MLFSSGTFSFPPSPYEKEKKHPTFRDGIDCLISRLFKKILINTKLENSNWCMINKLLLGACPGELVTT